MSHLAKKKIFYHRSWQRLIVGGLLSLSLFSIPFLDAHAAGTPAVISYQGRLADSSGNLLGGSSGTAYYFKFSLWDAAMNGNKLWPISANPTAITATVREGLFSVNIGDMANGYPDTLDYDFSNSGVFLKVEVSSNGSTFETLSPRQQLTSTAFAQMAGAVVSASSTISNLTGVNATTTNATTTNLFANVLSAGSGLFTSLQAPSLKTALTSTAGLILGSTSTPQILALDTINDRVQVGTGAGSNAPSLFVFDTKNTTGDPVGVNGAMYYNSNMNSFRCYQNGQWESCGGNATSTYFLVTGSSTLQSYTATNATTTNATTTNFHVSSIFSMASLAGFGTRCLQTDNNGIISASSSSCGGGSGGASGGTWSTTTSQVAGQFINYPNNSTDVVTVGNFATTTAPIYFDPNISRTKIFNQYFGTSSTTLQNVTAVNATTTNATSTSFAVSTLCLGGDCRSSWPSTSSSFAYPFVKLGTGENATSTTLEFNNGFVSTASSTLSTFTAASATTTSATSTDLYVSNLASTTQVRANVGFVGYLTSIFHAATNLLVNGSSTLQNFTASNATTTNATTTTLSTSTLCVGSDCRTAFPAASTFAYPFVKLGTGENATSTILSFLSGFLAPASSTLSSFTFTIATGTSATTSAFAISSIASKILKTDANGSIIAATAGADYLASMTFAWPFTKLGTGEQATSTIIDFAGGFMSNASSTLTTFTAASATTTNATSTTFSTGTLCVNGDCRTAFPAASTFAWPFTKLGTGEQATSTTVEFNNGLIASASSTLTTFTATNATTSQATTTNLAITGLSSALLSVSANGAVVATSTIGNNQLQNSTISGIALGGTLAALTAGNTLTSTGTYTGATGRTFDIDLTHANGWTGLQTFTNSTSTLFSSQYASTTILCISGDCRTAFPAASTFAWPWTKQVDNGQATSTLTEHWGGLMSASTTIGNNTTANGLTINGGATSTGEFLHLGSTTLQAFTAFKGTVTSATSTNLYFTNALASGSTTLQSVFAQNASTTLISSQYASSTILCISGDCRTTFPAASTFAYPFIKLGTGEQATSTTLEFNNGFVSTASSTLTTFTGTNATTTQATTTNLAVSSIANSALVKVSAGSGGSLVAATAGTDYLASMSFAFLFTKFGTDQSTTTLIDFFGGFQSTASSTIGAGTASTGLTIFGGVTTTGASLHLGSTTLQNFSGVNASTTLLSSQYASTTILCISGDCRTSFPAASTFAYPFVKLGTGENATSTTLEFNNGFVSTASSTLTSFTATNASTTILSATIASTSQLQISGKKDTLLSVDANGWVVASSSIGNNQLQNSTISGIALGGALANLTATDGTLTFSGTYTGATARTIGLALNNANAWTALQTFTNATSTLFSSQYASTTILCISGDCRTSFPSASTFAYPFVKLGTGEQATSTTLEFNNGFVSTASSTLTTFTATNATTSQATTTNLAVSSIAAGSIVKTSTGGGGALVAATAGTDYVAPATTITVSGATNQITSSAAAQDLSTNRTWTLSLPSLLNVSKGTTTEFSAGMAFFGRSATTTINGQGDLFVVGSTTLQNFSGVNASTTLFSAQYASTTILCLGGDVCRTTWPTSGAASFSYPFLSLSGNNIQATSTVVDFTAGVISNASSTLASTTATSFLATLSATTTDMYANTFLAFGSSTFQKLFSTSATATSLYSTNFLASGSTTLQSVFAQNASTTLISSQYASTTILCVSNDCRTAFPAALTFAWPFTKLGTNEQATSTTVVFSGSNSLIATASSTLASTTATSLLVTTSASTTNLFTNNLLANGSTTLQNFIGTSGTTTNEYTTNLNVFGSTTLQALYSTSFAMGTSSPRARLSINSNLNGKYAYNFFIGSNGSTTFAIDSNGRIGVGTSTPFAQFAIHTASSSQTLTQLPYLFAIGSTTNIASTGATNSPVTLFAIDNLGRVFASSTRPTVGNCGGSPTIVGTDSMGKVTSGTATGACVVTFAKTWGTAPYCIVTTGTPGDLTTGAPWISLAATTSATNLNITAVATSAAKITPNMGKTAFQYYCQGDIE